MVQIIEMALETTKGPCAVSKFYELWSTNAEKQDMIFYPHHVNAGYASGAGKAKVNKTIEIKSLVFRAPKRFYVANDIASGGLKWQYVVNCHFQL